MLQRLMFLYLFLLFAFSEAQAHQFKYNSPFKKSKVQLPSHSVKSAMVMSKSQSEAVLKQGTELILLVDTACAGTAYFKNSKGEALLATEARPYRLEASRKLSELSNEWNSNPCILGVSENAPVRLFQVAGSDPERSKQKHLGPLRWLESRALFMNPTYRSQLDVVIAIVDTGVDYNHSDLSSQMWMGSGGEKGANLVDGNFDPMDDNGHGTHCAGILAATENNNIGISGIASHRTKILPVKVLDEQGNGSLALLATGIRYAADQGADIINLSLGAPMSSSAVEDAVEYAVSKGSFVVMASGNNGELITEDNFYSPIGYAKSIQGAIGVGSIDAYSGAKSSFSNYSSSFVEIAAHGSAGTDKIYSTWPNNSYRAQHGTSMASPMVSGAAALVIGFLKSQGQAVTPELVEKILLDSSSSNDSLRTSFEKGRELNLLLLKRFLESSYLFQGRGGFEDL